MAELSANLLLPLLAKGDSAVLGYANWGAAARAAMEFLEDAVTESASIAVTGADVTLTDAEERALYITVTGTMSASLAVETSGRKGFWIVKNGTTGAFTLTFGPAAGTKVAIPRGQTVTIYCDGTDALAVGSGIGTDVTPTDGVFLVGDGTKFVGESGATARASMGANNASNLTTGTVPTLRLPTDLGENKNVTRQLAIVAPTGEFASLVYSKEAGGRGGALFWNDDANRMEWWAYAPDGATAARVFLDGDDGNLTLASAAGTMTAPFFSGNGASLTNLDGGSIATGVINEARIPATLNSARRFTDTVYCENTVVLADTAGTNIGRLSVAANDVFIQQVSAAGAVEDNWARFVRNGGAWLFFDGAKKFETTATGAYVTGNLTVSGNMAVDTEITFANNDKLAYDDVTNVYSFWGDGSKAGSIIEAGRFIGDGSTLTNLPAGQLTGTVAAARLSGTYNIAISGNAATASNATNLDGQASAFYRNASNLNAGTVDDARLPTTMAGKTFSSQITLAGFRMNYSDGNYMRLTRSEGTRLTWQELTAAGVFVRNFIEVNQNGETSLWFNSSPRLVTKSGGVDVNGDVTSNSDARLKTDLKPITGALDKVAKINGYTFIRNDHDDGRRYAGIVAQEIEKVLPEVVHEDQNGIKSVSYGNTVALLIEAIKELRREVATLKGAA